jgi:phosphoribosylanthranilate isomerase
MSGRDVAPVRVKVCGVTRPEDAVLSAELGASAIGLIFWPRSPRAVTVAQARAVARALPPFVQLVGVFVNQPVEEVRRMADEARLSAIQLHGDEDLEVFAGLAAWPLLKSVTAEQAALDPDLFRVPSRVTVLIDAHDPIRRGGTGRAVPWDVAATVAARRRLVLSGGLTPENVAGAIAAVRPWAVDVASGVEEAPGTKSVERLRAFFAAVQQAGAREADQA